MDVYILRLGHRIERDKRITTHVGLTARAFGAKGIILSGDEDHKVMDTWKKVVEEFGGDFEVRYEKNWRKVIDGWSGTIVHLTMYGLELEDVKDEIKRNAKSPLLLIVGGPKVPGEVYQKAHYNVAVGNQPHSEVAAVALILDRLLGSEPRRLVPSNAKKIVLPNPRGKTVKSNP